tara:strand:+ start:630 stop:1874 length:1245 start_codon:yes stop_codon:yes gene_type:complete
MVKIRTTPEEFQVEEQPPHPGLITEDDTKLPFAVFELTKTGWETQALLSVISKKIGIPVSSWGISGLKDKRSVTSQLITIPRNYAPKNKVHGSGWSMTPFGGAERPLKSGDHRGNRFTITVRDIVHRDVQLLPSRIAQVKSVGIPNWFDSQRFGSASGGFLPGQMLISGDLEGAMRLHLTSPQPSDRSSRRRDKKRLRLLWSNLDELELESIQYKPFKEILRAWKDKSNTPHEAMIAAYSAVPRSLRGLWISAWQSEIWNGVLRDIILSSYPDHLLRCIEIGVGGPLLYPRAPVGRRGRAKRSLIENIAQTLNTIPQVLEMPTLDETRIGHMHPSMQERITSISREGHQMVKSLGIKMSNHERNTVVFPTDLEASVPILDDLNGSSKHKRWKCTLSFDLPSGSYATNVVKRLFQ